MDDDQELKPDLDVVLDHTAKIVAKDLPPAEFYQQPDSIYIRLKYFPEKDAFKFDVKNELITHYTAEDAPKSVVSLAAFIRGMLEFALAYPHQMFRMGSQAMQADMVEGLEGLSDEQKALLLGSPEGSA